MTQTRAVIVSVLLAGAAITSVALQPEKKSEHPSYLLTKALNGIPVGTTMDWNNGKYVPRSVRGYESKADYPDSFWIYDVGLVKKAAK